MCELLHNMRNIKWIFSSLSSLIKANNISPFRFYYEMHGSLMDFVNPAYSKKFFFHF